MAPAAPLLPPVLGHGGGGGRRRGLLFPLSPALLPVGLLLLGGLLAGVYAVGCCLSSLAMGDMVQVGAAAAALENLGLPVWLSAGGMALLAFWVARGGLSLAGRIAGRLVPAMTLLFFAASLGVLWMFRENLPRAVASVFSGAFSPGAGAGGAAGWLLAMRVGVTRGVFTNEAGLGSAAFAYDGVEGRSPEELGCLGIFQEIGRASCRERV